jgi:hypothetical protein
MDLKEYGWKASEHCGTTASSRVCLAKWKMGCHPAPNSRLPTRAESELEAVACILLAEDAQNRIVRTCSRFDGDHGSVRWRSDLVYFCEILETLP